MSKKLLYILLSLLAFGPLKAVTLYDKDDQQFSIDGRVKVMTGVSKFGTSADDAGSRLTFHGKRDVTNNLSAFGVLEFSVDGQATASKEDGPFSLRLGNVGFKYNEKHVFTLGQLWGNFSDLVGYTDMGQAYGGAAVLAYEYESGTLLGSGRANKAVDYRFEGDALKMGVTLQGVDNDHRANRELSNRRDYSVGGRIEYKTGDVTAGAAVQYANMLVVTPAVKPAPAALELAPAGEPAHNKKDALFTVVGVKYVTDRVNLALTTNFTKNVKYSVDTLGAEMFAAYYYNTEKQSSVYMLYNYTSLVNQVENVTVDLNADVVNDRGTTELSELIFGMTYAVLNVPTLYVFVEGRADMRTKYQRENSLLFPNTDAETGVKQRRDAVTVGARYSF